MLVGLTLAPDWLVVERMPESPGRTQATFSVGYLVRNSRGRQAFCKALDYSSAMSSPEPAEELKKLADAYLFERDLLESCRARGMNRVVHAIASGTVHVEGTSPSAVNFLVFELADGDSRDALDAAEPGDFALPISLARDCAVALGQLHRNGVSHQDVKPANLLGWRLSNGMWSGKLGDLGRAYSDVLTAPHADLACPGDTNWSPPELLYGWPEDLPRSKRVRQLADLYSLGSFLCFGLVQVSHSALLEMSLDPDYRWANWQGGYKSARTFLVDAHERAIDKFAGALHADVQGDMVDLVTDLCHPLYLERGVLSRRRYESSFLLERYITRLDVLARRYPLTSTAIVAL